MRILLTGATGHSGKWFINRLIDEKYSGELVCLIRSGRSALELQNSSLNYSVIKGDASDPVALDIAMDGVDVLIHIAGIQISKNVMAAAIRNGVQWAILVHTTGRFSKYKSASAEYIEIEEEILKKRSENLSITILRPTMIYGSQKDVNMHKLIKYLNKHKAFPLFGKGDNLMQPVHARDLGNAYYDILIKPEVTKNKEYNLSGKRPVTYKDIIKITSSALNKRVFIIPIPFWISLLAAKVYNFMLGQKAIISVEQVLRMQEDKAFPYEEAAKDFGYDPIDFQEGIREEIELMRRDGLI